MCVLLAQQLHHYLQLGAELPHLCALCTQRTILRTRTRCVNQTTRPERGIFLNTYVNLTERHIEDQQDRISRSERSEAVNSQDVARATLQSVNPQLRTAPSIDLLGPMRKKHAQGLHSLKKHVYFQPGRARGVPGPEFGPDHDHCHQSVVPPGAGAQNQQLQFEISNAGKSFGRRFDKRAKRAEKKKRSTSTSSSERSERRELLVRKRNT